MTWKSHLCGGGLEKSIKDSIKDHLDAQGAMTAAVYKKKELHICNDITVFLKDKEMRWRDGRGDRQHLFGSGKEKQEMRKYCGKKVGGGWYILILKSDDYESA